MNTSVSPMPLYEQRLQFVGESAYYRGKVRDVHTLADGRLLMVASDRISAFDVVLPRPIPFKGQVLNQLAAYMLEAVSDIVPVWLEDAPDPNVAVGKRCEPIRFEILSRGIVDAELYGRMAEVTKALFARGRAMAAERGLILVDTKYEFGLHAGELMLMDEVHTPDSSRYFHADGFEARQAAGAPQSQLSKEFVREWLIEGGFMGRDGDRIPTMDDAFVDHVSRRYIALFEQMTGLDFVIPEEADTVARIQRNIGNWLREH
jgi:phosphoribosylaminoimidazole-succinocarboxamide synthase